MTTIRYCIYARKSSEQDEKQAMSIESQFREIRKIQEAEELDVVKIIEECKSAKNSFSRPGFTQLIAGLIDGEYEAILTWAVDRLSRNAGDLGLLVDLMDQKKLQVVRTHDQIFLGDNPNEKFLFMLLGSQAKLENENRAENVKRGMRAMREQGRRAETTPLGYKMIPGENTSDHNVVVIDEEWAPLSGVSLEDFKNMFAHKNFKFVIAIVDERESDRDLINVENFRSNIAKFSLWELHRKIRFLMGNSELIITQIKRT